MAVRTKHFAFINLTLQLVNVRHVINEIANLPVLIAAISMMKLKASRIVFTTPNTSNGGLILSVPCLNLLSSYVPLLYQSISMALAPRFIPRSFLCHVLFIMLLLSFVSILCQSISMAPVPGSVPLSLSSFAFICHERTPFMLFVLYNCLYSIP